MRFFSNRLERHHSSPLVPNDISNTLQFDGGVRNILRNVDQILVLAIDHAIEARTWIGTDEDVARVFDIIGIYSERYLRGSTDGQLYRYCCIDSRCRSMR